MVALFKRQAKESNVYLSLSGSSHNRPRLFDSFETIPLVLIDNAIKYAFPNTEVVVRLQDLAGVGDGCRVDVESRGDIIPKSEMSRIWERGFRGERATQSIGKGSGLGLYLAKIVADAHGAEMSYAAEPDSGSDKVGKNIFRVIIRSVQLVS